MKVGVDVGEEVDLNVGDKEVQFCENELSNADIEIIFTCAFGLPHCRHLKFGVRVKA
jgi:chemotaxis receptor (MCP) glutamine deamidase CheD